MVPYLKWARNDGTGVPQGSECYACFDTKRTFYRVDDTDKIPSTKEVQKTRAESEENDDQFWKYRASKVNGTKEFKGESKVKVKRKVINEDEDSLRVDGEQGEAHSLSDYMGDAQNKVPAMANDAEAATWIRENHKLKVVWNKESKSYDVLVPKKGPRTYRIANKRSVKVQKQEDYDGDDNETAAARASHLAENTSSRTMWECAAPRVVGIQQLPHRCRPQGPKRPRPLPRPS